jgi:hypothetical protein
LEVNIQHEKHLDQNVLLDQLNEQCKMSKISKLKLRNKHILAKQSNKNKNSRSNVKRSANAAAGDTFDKILKINHALGKGKIFKKKKKSFQQTCQEKLEAAKKQMKYKRLIKCLRNKQNKKSEDSSISNSSKRAEKRALVNNLNNILKEEKEETKNSQSTVIPTTENKEDKESTSKMVYDFDEDDDKPLSSIIKISPIKKLNEVKLKDEPVEQANQAVTGTATATTTVSCVTPKTMSVSGTPIVLDDMPHKANKKLDELKSVAIEETSKAPSTPIATSKIQQHAAAIDNTPTMQLAQTLGTSPSTAALIQKQNDTPTTSILKNRRELVNF